jgi:HAD superfamily hydrolase (TIGR01490 family)
MNGGNSQAVAAGATHAGARIMVQESDNREGRMETVRQAALFDMDRTLVRRDTATLFMRYQRDIGEAGRYQSVQAAWWVLLYTFGVCDAPRIAEKALARFEGRWEAQLHVACQRWFEEYVKPHISDAARAAVARHRQAGDVVAMVTGALAFAARPVAAHLGIDLVVCSEVEVNEGRLTGRTSQLCYGATKVDLAQQIAEAESFRLENATFYSDSITDLPLLERVAHPIVVNPDSRLRRIAVRRNWPILSW